MQRERKRSYLVFILIVIVTTLLTATIFIMWRSAISLRDQTQYEYQYFQDDIFQKSAFTSKAIASLFKLRFFETGKDPFVVEKQSVDSYARAIAGHKEIAYDLNELYVRLPDDDPLMLKAQLSALEPDLKSIVSIVNDLYDELQNVDSTEGLSRLLQSKQAEFDWSITRLNRYLNVQTKIQSVFFAEIQTSLNDTIRQLSTFFYIISGLFLLNLLLFLLYLKDRRAAQLELEASHSLLETRVVERTAELQTSKRLLEEEMAERRHMEYQLRLKSDAIENSLSGFDIVDEEGKFVYANRAYLKMWGYDSLDEILGTSPSSHCKDPEYPDYIITKLKEKGEFVFEFVARRKDGSYFDVLMYGRLAFDENGKEIYPTTSVDITERKHAEENRKLLEEQLMHARKMEAIGTLSGGVAHEFNNILAILIGNIELSLIDTSDTENVKEYLGEMKNASLRGKKVVQQLLNFSRKTRGMNKQINLKKTIRDTLGLLNASLPAQVTLEEDFAEDCSDIIGDSGQIQQAVMNLCANSTHAMGEHGGTITVRLANTPLHNDETFTDTVLGPGDYVCLTLIDSGSGIPGDIIDRVFDPFFTTKDIDEGSGMGLSVVHGIVKAHGGGIRISSLQNKGCEVVIYFPAAPVDLKNDGVSGEVGLPGGTESILFVDDEEYIAKLGMRSLSKLGYEVTTFTEPQVAVAAYEESPGSYDLVISDMSMPTMTGDTFIQKLKKINPEVKVVISTGFSETVDEENVAEFGAAGYLGKPFSIDELATIVRHVLTKE